MSKISIISPSFNQAAYVSRMTASVSCQTHVDYEHLVLDPGSTDGTIQHLKEYAAVNPKAILVLEPDRGQVHAINKGLAWASGSILAWLNSDDFFADPEVLEIVDRYFSENPAIDIAYGRGVRVDGEGSPLRAAFVHPPGTNFQESLEHSLGILQPSVFFRRRVYEGAGGLDESWPLQLDYELWIRFAQMGFSFGFIDHILSRATVHAEAKSTKLRLCQLGECLELVLSKFGFAASVWILRYADFFLTGQDEKLGEKKSVPEELEPMRDQIRHDLLLAFNGPPCASGSLQPSTAARRRTLDEMRQLRVAPPAPRRLVVTAFDSEYFNQGLNLIAGLHRTSLDSFDEIFVYSLGLDSAKRARLAALEKTTVLDFPADIAQRTFPEFLDPRGRAYKSHAMLCPEAQPQAGDLILWMDAGLTPLRDIGDIFGLVAKQGFFITNHDESRFWPLYNLNFLHRESLSSLRATHEELVAEHLNSAMVGHTCGGPFQHLVDEARELGRQKSVIYWPKHTDNENPKSRRPKGDAESRLRANLLNGSIVPSSVPLESLCTLFPFHGHRTQSILSILAFRHGAPVSSSKTYRVAGDLSSEAAKTNWLRKATETDALANRTLPPEIGAETFCYHHRGLYDNIDGLRFRRSSPALFILGSGPSLRGFDFHRLSRFESLGMNAAYRFWDRIQWYPTYYACFDTVLQETHAGEIARLIEQRSDNGIRTFFLRKTILDKYPHLADESSVFFLEDLQARCSIFPPEKITTGSFSAFVGLFLGYRRLFLLGIDLNYVEKLPEARAVGRALEIAETPAENPNYFFDGYQLAGDRYNPPNRHPGLHMRSWQQLKEFLARFPAEVVNLNSGSGLRDFGFETFEDAEVRLAGPFSRPANLATEANFKVRERAFWRQSLLASLALPPLLGPFERSAAAHFDETAAIAAYLADPKKGAMLDVGAHHGSALKKFLEREWRVWAFEPDHKNRAKLLERLAAHKNRDLVTLDTRCVSHTSQKNLPFFQSGESTGISGLSAFRDTHLEAQRVDTVSLSDYFADKEMPVVDFLKIDTEGHDLFVLQGFPWERNRPKVIECEFEDLKSKPLGYTTKDMADFLVGKGYTVYVSEWHPILKYGQRHDWHRLQKYPCDLACYEAWGNLLAFSEPPDEAKLIAAIKSVLKSAAKSAPTSGPSAQKNSRKNPEVADCFTPVSSDCWLFIKKKTGQQNLLIFPHNTPADTVGREYQASFRLVCDMPVQIAVTLARHDHKRPYEGTTIKQKLTPGQPWSGAIKHRFKENHADLKLQFEILDCPTATCTLEIQGRQILESPATLVAELSKDTTAFAAANAHFRDGRFAEAAGLYASLAKSQPGIPFHKTMARDALQRLGTQPADFLDSTLEALLKNA